MTQIKVSVVVPVYNAEEFLDETLSYISGQSLREIEIICVDDGSEDGSCGIIEQWQKKDSRIRLIRQQNQYAGAARNNGMKYASGKYIIFWDADDLFHKDALEKLYFQAEKENTDICICAAQRYDNEKKKYVSSDAYLREEFLPDKETFNKSDIPDHIFNLATNVPWNKLYRREFITEHSLEYQKIKQANDTYFTMMAFFLAERISFVKEVLISYRVNNNRSLSGKASDTVFCAWESYVYTKEKLEQYPEYAVVENSFKNRALSGFYHALNIQTSFSSYEKLYTMLVEEGFDRFGITKMAEEEFQLAWTYRDLKKMCEMSAGDFLVMKSMERRLNNEKEKASKKELKEKNKQLKEKEKTLRSEKKHLESENKKMTRKLEVIENSKAYRLGNVLMWLPHKVKTALSRMISGRIAYQNI